jgi:glutaminase
MTAADRFEKLQNKFAGIVRDDNELSSNFHVGFDNAVYMSERDTGFNNYALAHFMRVGERDL